VTTSGNIVILSYGATLLAAGVSERLRQQLGEQASTVIDLNRATALDEVIAAKRSVVVLEQEAGRPLEAAIIGGILTNLPDAQLILLNVAESGARLINSRHVALENVAELVALRCGG
jgi:hypothetical protein